MKKKPIENFEIISNAIYDIENDRILCTKGATFKIYNKIYEYVGDFYQLNQIPNKECLFTMNNLLFLKIYRERFISNMIEDSKTEAESFILNSSKKNDFPISEDDDILMVALKGIVNSITENQLKKILPKSADYSNFVSGLKNKNTTTMKELNKIIRPLNLSYKIVILDVDKMEVKF